MSHKSLILEILNGPMDGHKVKLEKETFWGKKGEGPLIFPWDTELGEPQARFLYEEEAWGIEGYKAPHGTYCLNRQGYIERKLKLEKGDILKASTIWMMVREIGRS